MRVIALTGGEGAAEMLQKDLVVSQSELDSRGFALGMLTSRHYQGLVFLGAETSSLNPQPETRSWEP